LAKIQYQEKNKCFITTIPKEVIDALGAKKGDTLHYNITKSGKIEVIKIKEKCTVDEII
jgi:bifunctional DNA-binding transcriptional regulator/antitoxin component of YhaV-PrlF toxin-antitoxin module